MTTGPDGGAYPLFAQRYGAHLARENISITLKPSARSIENLQRLQSAGSDVEVGLVQAGLGSGDTAPGLRSLGAVYYEPLWLFYRGPELIDRLSQLADKRVAIGVVGSGSRALALQLLKASGVDTFSPNLSPLGGTDAVKALIEEDVDAVLLVAAPTPRSYSNLPGPKISKSPVWFRPKPLRGGSPFSRRFSCHAGPSI
jgi:TRAP-type uncharacterized transport system substrate-binding protein